MAVHAFNVKLFRICQLNMFNFKLNGNYSEMFKYISVKKSQINLQASQMSQNICFFLIYYHLGFCHLMSQNIHYINQ